MALVCDKCGSTVEKEDIYCNSCGAQLNKTKVWVGGGTGIEGTETRQETPSQQYQTRTRPKKLYRSKENRWLAGVCGGLGEYLQIDPIFVRIGFILFSFGYGAGLIIYIIFAIFLEENPDQMDRHPPRQTYRQY